MSDSVHALSEPGAAPAADVDLDLLRVYLNDHLAGAVAGPRRMRKTGHTLSRTPVAGLLEGVAEEVEGEREELRALMRSLGLPQARAKQVATWLGERVSRLKANGRWTQHSPMTPLLEVELLRSAVMGKRGLWQTLTELGPALGLETSRPAALVAQTDRQLQTLDEVHRYVRRRALRNRGVSAPRAAAR